MTQVVTYYVREGGGGSRLPYDDNDALMYYINISTQLNMNKKKTEMVLPSMGGAGGCLGCPEKNKL